MAKVTWTDIERSLHTQLVAEEDDFSTRIINSAMDGILAYDLRCRYTLWNPSMERLTGRKAESVLGRCAFEIFPELESEPHKARFLAALGGETVHRELPTPLNGKMRWIQSTHSPLFDDLGNITGGLAVLRDVTEQRLGLEEIKRLHQELEKRVEERTADLQFLSDAGLVLSNSLDFETTLASVVSLTTRKFDGWCLIRFTVDGGLTVSRSVAGHSYPPHAQMIDELEARHRLTEATPAVHLEVMRTGVSKFIPFVSVEPEPHYSEDHLAALRAIGAKSHICAALVARGRILGAISCFSSSRHYSKHDVRVAEDLGRIIGLALDNARIYAEASATSRS